MTSILLTLTEIFSQPAFLMGIISLAGLLSLRSPLNKLLTGICSSEITWCGNHEHFIARVCF